MELLLDNGADVNMTDNEGQTPLDVAMQDRCLSAVEYLREHGARNNNFRPNIALAAYYYDIAKVKELLDAGGDINSTDNGGWTALHFAVAKGNKELTEFLIGNGADIDARESGHAIAPFHSAVTHGHKDTANLLLAKGANIDTSNINRTTALHIVARSYDKTMAKWLLEKGCSVNLMNRDGKTALDFAVTEEMRKILLSHGARTGEELREESK